MDALFIQISEDDKKGIEFVIVDRVSKEISVLIKKSVDSDLVEVDLTGMSSGVIDLERTGRRWEGGVLNGYGCGCECPCGYGNEYNDDNVLVYEGFVYDGRRVCYGKEYRGVYNNNNNLIYEGCYI